MVFPDWTLVIPVKPLSDAKTRLRGAVPAIPHERLVLALTLDTVAVAVDCAEVYLVCDDPAIGRAAAALGARVLPDEPRAGLNAAVEYGAAHASGWVGALAADLPALRPAELRSALSLAAGRSTRSFVADAAGTGTTLLTAPPGAALDPRFGPGSAAAHAASGAHPLRGHWPSLRRDVDTVADLAAAAQLGLGPHLAALGGLGRHLAALGGLGPHLTALGGGGRVDGVQGTVATYDTQTRTGTLLLDDGTQLAFPAAAFDASGLRFLRLGQRVRIEQDESGQVVRVTLPTFP